MEGYDRFLVKEDREFKLLCRDMENLYLVSLGKTRGSALEMELSGMSVAEIAALPGKEKPEAIPRSTLRAIALEGLESGDLFYLCLTGAWRPLVLREFLSQEFLDVFFGPVPHYPMPEDTLLSRKHPGYWRVLLRDPLKLPRLKQLEYGLAGLGSVAAGGFFLQRDLFWFCMCCLSVLIPVILDIWMPGYFTLEMGQKNCGQASVNVLVPLIPVSIALFWVNGFRFPEKLMVLTALCGVGATLLLLLGREFRQHKGLLAGALLLACFLSFGFLQNANALLPQPEPVTSQAGVLHLWRGRTVGRRNRNSYRCMVKLPDGSKHTFPVSKGDWDILDTGYTPLCHHYQGALGIEYYILDIMGQEYLEVY